MLNFSPKKCLCNVADCGKCLTLGCTNDSCSTHRIVTKWRYRKHLLESLTNKIEKMRDSKPEKELATLRKDIKTCKEEVKRLGEVMGMKNNE
ncbi:hypothetical protein A3B05_00010 [Candidatus Giovannonibacteria bacterium RIFCSPLOWO2_01_FULL_43_160]|uniref:Uncharacterized protein n=2 Tax=Candidatus Giovannoniibacteriota TaxID=1752738 RepID=A0A0G1IWP8_9BACT|nr:MAG: hypothetical protein UV72_C0001G0066 [Candidatus Giovannonibacteria bacterium GW2011_GWB1_43_13]KKS99731.1 MAG: hypothetical protein UV75_C0002G0112 [Candidatus Giovannonibacteria bacterium GW2011_GWA1_43_15]KKT21859.1 MAG: hypothetical protein UW05_C0001G0006 [Candidatus Giovannonibacteria bacterium GW2011_GWC2_43_8]KKT63816.1 MAG: hypothetical protein UW55_C0001G0109 [Candidatus Giovannonibacteria bacterium GW2011_GWA2_44_26]OGF58884.1 MAG: hypothetical protein A2652_03450 [Candidatus